MRISFLALFVFSCSIIPDDALNNLPGTARVTSLTIREYDFDENKEPKNETIGQLFYQGTFGKPSKIEIAWSGNLKIMQIPIFDEKNKIVKTVYELNNGKVSKITNINNENKEARVETFTYNNAGRLTQHTLKNNYNGSIEYEFSNHFFYKSGEIDSVSQTVCLRGQSCWSGFFIMLDETRTSPIAVSKCNTSQNRTTVNYLGILPYDEDKPFSYQEGIYSYWNEETNTYEKSVNDFQKIYHALGNYNYSYYDDDEDTNILTSISQYDSDSETQQETCVNHTFDIEIDYGYKYGDDDAYYGHDFSEANKIFDNYRFVSLTSNRDGLYFNPGYYYLIPRLIPEYEILIALGRKIDHLYYSEYTDDIGDQSDSELRYYFDIQYDFEVQ